MVGYACVSYAEGNDRIVSRLADSPALVLILVTAGIAVLIGGWLWAGLFGGALHVSARALGGKPGFAQTVRAVGYGFFWPGILSAAAASLILILGYRGDALPRGAAPLLYVQIGAGLWGVYTVIAALRARHEFGWARAIGTYVLTFLVFIVGFVIVRAVAAG
jgi:hypothetical protein